MVSVISGLSVHPFTEQSCYRLINSKYPPKSLFDDVAGDDEFEAVFAIQKLTNPRLRNEIGELNLVPLAQRPFGINGCHYAMGPFVHVNPEGSRFSAGQFGVFYAAENIQTAIAETRYHQENYFKKVQGLKFDRIVMRGLKAVFTADLLNILNPLQTEQGWYHPDDYSASRILGNEIKKNRQAGVLYGSVRNNYQPCYALFSPEYISEVIQCSHYEYIWDGKEITSTLKISDSTE